MNTYLNTIISASKLLVGISETPRLDAEVIMAHVLHIERHALPLYYNTTITKDIELRFSRLIKRRLKSEPVAYITGYREFYSLPFKVNRHVLIPRPETELLVDYAIYYAKSHATIIDIGTGSGAIAIAIKYSRPDCIVWATDISAHALDVAKKNANAILGTHSITFVQSNLFNELPEMKFDIIVSNPPYIDPDDYIKLPPDLHYEPRDALIAPQHGFGIIKLLLDKADKYLSPDGIMILEIGQNILNILQDHIQQTNYTFSVLKDYAGLPRIVIVKK